MTNFSLRRPRRRSLVAAAAVAVLSGAALTITPHMANAATASVSNIRPVYCYYYYGGSNPDRYLLKVQNRGSGQYWVDRTVQNWDRQRGYVKTASQAYPRDYPSPRVLRTANDVCTQFSANPFDWPDAATYRYGSWA